MNIPNLLLPLGNTPEQYLRELHKEVANYQFRSFFSHGEVVDLTTLNENHFAQLWEQGLLPRIQFEDQIIYRFCDVEPLLYAMFRPFPAIWRALHLYIFGYNAEHVMHVGARENLSWFYEKQLFPTCFRAGSTWAPDGLEDPRVIQLRAFIEGLTDHPTSDTEPLNETATRLLTKYYPMWERGDWHATHLPDGCEREIV
jgi:hypothetical protein